VSTSDPSVHRDGYALVLRACTSDLRSHGGFQWPASGSVECVDWNPEPECGGGLHGWLWGEGSGDAHGGAVAPWRSEAKWLVVELETSAIVHLDGKVKFPRGVVVFCGDRIGATEYLRTHGGAGKAIIGGTVSAGYAGTATAGYAGTATAGEGGTICFQYWCPNMERYRVVVAEVGEDGVEPDTAYVLDVASRKPVRKA
jgi:hypothetical protein